jgi:ABC-type antimicrobial peptide transport system permease subunit
MAATLLTIFAVLALALATVGLYGVMTYVVGQRTRELGIRIAIGAQRQDVLKLILAEGLTMSAIGVLGGAFAAAAVTRFAAHMLYGVSTTDPVTFALVALLLPLVALAAVYIPARRATRVDPVFSLKYD